MVFLLLLSLDRKLTGNEETPLHLLASSFFNNVNEFCDANVFALDGSLIAELIKYQLCSRPYGFLLLGIDYELRGRDGWRFIDTFFNEWYRDENVSYAKLLGALLAVPDAVAAMKKPNQFGTVIFDFVDLFREAAIVLIPQILSLIKNFNSNNSAL